MTWRRNTSQEEVEEVRRFVEDMKRGLTPVTGDSLLETLRQIHDRREAETPRPEHRQQLLERLRRQMAERDGAEPEYVGGREVVFLPQTRPRAGLRWAIAASLLVHAAIGGVVLTSIRFNPSIVAKVLATESNDPLRDADIMWVPLGPIGTVGNGSTSDRARNGSSGAGGPRVASNTTDGASGVEVPSDGAFGTRVASRTAPVPAQPVAPSQVAPFIASLGPKGDEFGARSLEDGAGPDLSGPPEPSEAQPGLPSTFTEVLAASAARDIDTQPHILARPRPEYTPDALEASIQGYVYVSAVLGADGKIHDVRVLRGLGHGLDEAAMKAVRQIRFIPATKDGVQVSVTQTIKVAFSLR